MIKKVAEYYTCVGGTVIAQSKEAAEQFEKEYYGGE